MKESVFMTRGWMVAALAAVVAGCSPATTGTSASSPSGAASEGPGTPSSTGPGAKKCGPDGLVDDCEDNDNKVSVVKGRAGYWYTFGDKAGSTITPPLGGTFPMSAGGAAGSAYAAHISGKIGTASIVYTGVGFNFVDPKGIYDASAYKGISFWAKVGSKSTTKVRLKVPDIDTDPTGKVCGKNGTDEGCFNDFGKDLELTTKWTQYTITFADMQQGQGWGDPRPPAINPAKLYGVQWQVNTKGADYDLWIDDVQFTGCP